MRIRFVASVVHVVMPVDELPGDGPLQEHERGAHAHGYNPTFLPDPATRSNRRHWAGAICPFPPSRLPAASRRGVMQPHQHRFGDKAEPHAATTGEIGDLLVGHASGATTNPDAERSARASKAHAAPLRTAQAYYSRGKHRRISAKMARNNPAIRSFSRCNACYSGAGQGDFSGHGA